MKTQCLQTKWDAALLERKMLEKQGGFQKGVALIKILIMRDRKEALEARL
jgi:hypothetical protein